MLNEYKKDKFLSSFIINENTKSKTNFDFQQLSDFETYEEMEEYCDANLRKLGEGSSRAVYVIGDGTRAVKIALNDAGIDQNENEIKWGYKTEFAGDILAEIFDYGDDASWLLVETALPLKEKNFQKAVGYPMTWLRQYLIYEKHKAPISNKILKALEDDEFANTLADFMFETSAPAGDLSKVDSFGVVHRNGKNAIVLIDYGLSDKILRSHYL